MSKAGYNVKLKLVEECGIAVVSRLENDKGLI
jgi:hypothetical protein